MENKNVPVYPRELPEIDRLRLVAAAGAIFPISSERLRLLEKIAMELESMMIAGDFPEEAIEKQAMVIAEIQELRQLLEYAERLIRTQWSSLQWMLIAGVAFGLSVIAYLSV